MKPINIIVLTDGVLTDDLESVFLAAAKRLDHINAPSWQVDVHFLQVSNEQEAQEALIKLDDMLRGSGGIKLRNMVVTGT